MAALSISSIEGIGSFSIVKRSAMAIFCGERIFISYLQLQSLSQSFFAAGRASFQIRKLTAAPKII
jgi:hypothetical protein